MYSGMLPWAKFYRHACEEAIQRYERCLKTCLSNAADCVCVFCSVRVLSFLFFLLLLFFGGEGSRETKGTIYPCWRVLTLTHPCHTCLRKSEPARFAFAWGQLRPIQSNLTSLGIALEPFAFNLTFWAKENPENLRLFVYRLKDPL